MKKWGNDQELYCKKIYDALMRNPSLLREGGIYAGREGCLRLAREYGCGLIDYRDDKKIKEDIQASYSTLCVRAYSLKPPISAKEWTNEILCAIQEGRK